MVNNNFDWYCQVFIDVSLDIDCLRNLIAEITNGKHDTYSLVENDCLKIHVRKNHDYDNKRKTDSFDGFLFYKFFLDIAPITTKIKFVNYVQQIKSLIKQLRDKGYSVVPACDYEDELNDENYISR